MSTTYESDTMVGERSLDLGTLPPMIPVDVADKPFSFEDDPEDIRISDRFDDAGLDTLVEDLQFFDANGLPCADMEERRKQLRNFLAFHGGSGVRELLNYRPRNIDGIGFYDPKNSANYAEGHFVFGRIYTPAVLGFSALVKVKREQFERGDFKINVPWFNSSIRRDLIYSMQQEIYIEDEPVDLVIRVTYRIVRWQDPDGYHFYITEMQNRDPLIDIHPAKNPYDTPAGFETLGRMPGEVSQFNVGRYPDTEGPEFSVKRHETFLLELTLPRVESLNLPGFDFVGEATALEEVDISYGLMSQYRYRFYNALKPGDVPKRNQRRLAHYWSHV